MKVAVVILNYNGLRYLQQFLGRIVANCPSYAEVIVADNASTDGSVQWLEKDFPTIKRIQHNFNKGFAGGYNDALRQIEADYFVILNSDIEVTDGWLPSLIDFMESNSEVAACQPKILSYHNKNSFEYAGAAGGFIDVFGFPFCRGRVFTTLENDEKQYDDVKKVFWVTGACMIIRSELFFEAGGFDDFFFAHMEEIDLCWRLQRMKYSVVSLPYSHVYHIGGGTLSKNSSMKTFLNYRNNLSMLAKNLPALLLLPVFLFRIFTDVAAAFVFLFYSGPSHGFAVLKAYFSFLLNLPSLVNKRRLFNKNNSAKLLPTIYRRPIMLDYFILRRREYRMLKFGE
ncbi:MAG: glycosyltransferase family 2 protein [Bacteroidia bacterium]|nr:glycosyltransferase family 2 protein [Bacteroidia bacterium]